MCGLLLLFCAPPAAGQAPEIRFLRTIRIQPPPGGSPSRFAALSANSRGDLYVCDISAQRVFHLDPDGQVIREVGGFGWNDEQFDRPVDVWAQNALDVFVADYNNHRIQRFDRNLNFVSTLSSENGQDAALRFGFPVALAYSNYGELFIAGREHNRILKFDANGTPVLSFGDYDWGAGAIEEPVDICVGKGDEVWVADATRKSLVRFDYYGNYLQELKVAQITQPARVAAAGDDLAVVDAATSRVFLLHTATGEPTEVVFKTHLAAPAASEMLLDVAVAQNVLYVLEGISGEIVCFQLSNAGR